ncbi:hypothetical protein Pmani_037489 [Petrolisthes manimaculis]|uniref:PSP proline-rich domain-containing protein n=1 Tax=Petrolisthes manimaculis TaxID=1843537 RepID=A0AAE1TN93_9EUCA|nr:hypothetical protein Pmani_037489 [Petrolisthes manimaculis]
MAFDDSEPEAERVCDRVSEEDVSKSTDLELPEGVNIETDLSEILSTRDENSPASQGVVTPTYRIDTKEDYDWTTMKAKSTKFHQRPLKKRLNDRRFFQPPSNASTYRNNNNGYNKKRKNSRNERPRYYEPSDKKYNHYRPGHMSYGLRQGLGLRHDELPLFVYRMRVYGYPPGWLREAEVPLEKIKVFDDRDEKEGEIESTVSPMDLEEGEIEPSTVRYYPHRIISYPGFNDPLPPGVTECGSKEEGEISDDYSQNSINDLELKRERLLLLIQMQETSEEETSDKNDPNSETMSCQQNLEENKTLQDKELSNETKTSDYNIESRSHHRTQTQQVQLEETGTPDYNIKSRRHHRTQTLQVHYGTFIPESNTPYISLPDAEKWSVNISDYLSFENLPDALGTWNKIKGVMRKVKNRIRDRHTDNV